MTIRIGRPNIKQLPPKNYGMAGVAQATLDRTIAISNRQYEEALKVDGVEGIIIHRTKSGSLCTCRTSSERKQELELITEEGYDPEDQPNETTPEDFDGPTFGTFASRRYDLHYKDEKPSNDIETIAKSINIFADDLVNNKTILDEDNDDTFKLINEINEGTFQGFDTTAFGSSCPICFGVGYNHAFNPSNGQRYVFDATETYNPSTSGVAINRTSGPYRFETDNDQEHYVEWTFRLPAYYLKMDDPIVYNGKEPIKANVFVRIGSDLTPLTPFFLEKFKGTSHPINIQVRPPYDLNQQRFNFTHMVLTVYATRNPIIQLGQIAGNLDRSFTMQKTTTEFAIPSTISNLRPDDLIYEHRYHRLWLISSVNPQITSKQQIYANTASGTLVAPVNLLSLLAPYKRVVPLLAPYQALVPIQGEE